MSVKDEVDLKPSRWTVQIMPEGGGPIRHFKLSRRVVRLALAAGSLAAVLAIGFAASLGLDAIRETELARLRIENRGLSSDLDRMELQVATLDRFIDGLTERDQQIRLLAGLPYIDPDVQAVGVGGPLVGDPSREEFVRLSGSLATRALAATYDVDKLVRRV